MADCFTKVSRVLDVRTPENTARAIEIYEAGCTDGALDAQFSNGFFASISSADTGARLWIRDEGAGDPESAIRFVKICTAEFGLSGRWGFQYSNTCSKPLRSRVEVMSIPDHAQTNFQTLLRAAENGHLALMECADAATGEPRYGIMCSGARWARLPLHALRPSCGWKPL
jgi:hypothetical protein